MAMSSRPPAERWTSWQSMDSGRLLLMAVSGMLVLAAFANLAVSPLSPIIAVSFGLFIAFGEVLRLALPGGREAAPIAMAGALAYALLLGIKGYGHSPAQHTALQVIAVAAIGMAVGALPHVAAGRPPGLTSMCIRLVTVACVAFIFHPLANSPVIYKPRHWGLALIVMIVLVTFGWLIEILITSLIRADDVGARFSVALWDEMRVQWPLGAAVAASAIITVFAAKIMGLIELLVFLGPLLVTQIAFRRYAGIRATYLQTVRSLARVTEVGGYVESGHSRRVAKLAVSVGRELGMAEPDLLNLEYAALMHDIGQLSLVDPIPGGGDRAGVGPRTRTASPSWAPRSSGRRACSTRWPAWCAASAGPAAATIRTRRSAARSSARPTRSTTWSAGRSTGTAPPRRWNGCGWTPSPSTTRAWSRR